MGRTKKKSGGSKHDENPKVFSRILFGNPGFALRATFELIFDNDDQTRSILLQTEAHWMPRFCC